MAMKSRAEQIADLIQQWAKSNGMKAESHGPATIMLQEDGDERTYFFVTVSEEHA